MNLCPFVIRPVFSCSYPSAICSPPSPDSSSLFWFLILSQLLLNEAPTTVSGIAMKKIPMNIVPVPNIRPRPVRGYMSP